MTATVAAGPSASGRGIRPFDPGRDLSALADLIEVGFAQNLDPSGQRLVRGLRALGRFGWLGGQLSRWLLPPAANPQGYVWEQDGVVLGNASLLPVTGYPQRWVLANVVVLPGQRRRGIGRILVKESIQHARRRGAQEIILQVDHDNEGAISLYHKLGFRSSIPRTSWVGRLSHMSLPAEQPQVRRRERSEWQQQYRLARVLHPEGLVWPFPASAGYFRPRVLAKPLGLGADRHWVWVEDDRIDGSASLRWGLEAGSLRLILLVEQERKGELEGALVTAALNTLQPFGDVVQLDYPKDVAGSTFKEIGFSAQRHLLWMRLLL